MKKSATIFTSMLLCLTMLIVYPTQLVASAADNSGKKYISEVKVGMGGGLRPSVQGAFG